MQTVSSPLIQAALRKVHGTSPSQLEHTASNIAKGHLPSPQLRVDVAEAVGTKDTVDTNDAADMNASIPRRSATDAVNAIFQQNAPFGDAHAAPTQAEDITDNETNVSQCPGKTQPPS